MKCKHLSTESNEMWDVKYKTAYKIVVFRIYDTTVGEYQCFGVTCCLHFHLHGSSRFLQNTGIHLKDYMISQPRSPQFNLSLPRKPKISHKAMINTKALISASMSLFHSYFHMVPTVHSVSISSHLQDFSLTHWVHK
jgi:hypothetical protein